MSVDAINSAHRVGSFEAKAARPPAPSRPFSLPDAGHDAAVGNGATRGTGGALPSDLQLLLLHTQGSDGSRGIATDAPALPGRSPAPFA